jgi:hypothetical protein
MFIAACSTGESIAKKSTVETSNTKNGDIKKETTSQNEHRHNPNEPHANTLCAFCDMKVYEKAHSFGAFTAQGVTKDGEYVYFDDIGCILNYERKTNVKLAKKWVRDYFTLEWTELDTAIPVKTTLETPMKYGYVLFKDIEKANEFIENEENSNIFPTAAKWSEIDNMANERYQMRMKKQQQTQMGHS